MRGFIILTFFLLFGMKSFGLKVPSPWTDITDITVADFKKLGFKFECDDTMAKHYKQPVVEVVMLVPAELISSERRVQFHAIGIESDECAGELAARPYREKKRAILTISRRLAGEATIVFYYTIDNEDIISGSRYRLPVKAILQDWEDRKSRISRNEKA